MQTKTVITFVAALVAACLNHGMQAGTLFAAGEEAAAQEKEQKFTEKMAAILFEGETDSFFYQREGRNDPFEPFVQERVVAKEVPIEVLTGMRKFEPGQLSVVAIVASANDIFAMVQDSNNQGYIIREGILLGRTGVVTAVEPNKVIVRNYTYNLAGDKIYKTVEMVLKQEGEK